MPSRPYRRQRPSVNAAAWRSRGLSASSIAASRATTGAGPETLTAQVIWRTVMAAGLAALVGRGLVSRDVLARRRRGSELPRCGVWCAAARSVLFAMAARWLPALRRGLLWWTGWAWRGMRVETRQSLRVVAVVVGVSSRIEAAHEHCQDQADAAHAAERTNHYRGDLPIPSRSWCYAFAQQRLSGRRALSTVCRPWVMPRYSPYHPVASGGQQGVAVYRSAAVCPRSLRNQLRERGVEQPQLAQLQIERCPFLARGEAWGEAPRNRMHSSGWRNIAKGCSISSVGIVAPAGEHGIDPTARSRLGAEVDAASAQHNEQHTTHGEQNRTGDDESGHAGSGHGEARRGCAG
jgi:hypothetical protein